MYLGMCVYKHVYIYTHMYVTILKRDTTNLKKHEGRGHKGRVEGRETI